MIICKTCKTVYDNHLRECPSCITGENYSIEEIKQFIVPNEKGSPITKLKRIKELE